MSRARDQPYNHRVILRSARHAFLFSLCLWGAVRATLSDNLPENPLAFGNCTATVRVNAARLRAGPSLSAPVLGLRLQEDSLFVLKVEGKWARVVTPQALSGNAADTAYMAAYLLAFPYRELLEQWKRAAPQPSVGRKNRVKWAFLDFRKYPSSQSPVIAAFQQNDVVGELLRLPHGWSLIEGAHHVVGFVTSSALEPLPDLPGLPNWGPPLSPAMRDIDEPLLTDKESPGGNTWRAPPGRPRFAAWNGSRARPNPPI